MKEQGHLMCPLCGRHYDRCKGHDEDQTGITKTLGRKARRREITLRAAYLSLGLACLLAALVVFVWVLSL